MEEEGAWVGYGQCTLYDYLIAYTAVVAGLQYATAVRWRLHAVGVSVLSLDTAGLAREAASYAQLEVNTIVPGLAGYGDRGKREHG